MSQNEVLVEEINSAKLHVLTIDGHSESASHTRPLLSTAAFRSRNHSYARVILY